MPTVKKSKIESENIIDASIEMTEMLELSDEDFKAVIVKIRQQTIINTCETNENIESFIKEIEDLKTNNPPNGHFRTEKQLKIKILKDRFSSRSKRTEDRIIELEDRRGETIQSE